MAKEQFFYPATQSLFKKLEQLSHVSSVSRGQGFEDWLTAMTCALAAETKEEEYLAMIERHKKGKKGQRGADLMAEMFASLVNAMSASDEDILGDLYMGALTYGESGQFFSPGSIARMMAELSVDPDARPTRESPIYVHDCCCGSGRMLLEAAKVNPHVELVGLDVDARCAKISALNLSLRGHYGWVVCGNAISGKMQFAYRIGSFFHEGPNGLRRGLIRDVPPEGTPIPFIISRTEQAARGLLAERGGSEEPSEFTLPKIIEIPEWLSRLEPRLAALEREERETVPKETQATALETKSPTPKQRDLF